MFLAPWFLAGLLAIGLPIWLHRIARTERIKLPFASLMLLQASEVRDTSRRSLRYWILLAIRIALLIALALAFAQPLLRSDTGESGTQAQLHAIVIDASLSMQHGARWTRALEQARKLIDGLRSGDRALLVAASGRKIELLAGPVFAADASDLRAALASVQPSLQRLDYGMLMNGSKAWITAEGLPSHLHLITDLQQSASPLRFADLEPPANTRIEIHDVGQDANQPAPSNWSIGNVAVRGAQERALTVTVKTGDAQDAARDAILLIDDREYARKRVVAAASTVDTVFTGIKLGAGGHRLQVKLEPHDALPQDDHYYAVIEHTEPRVLLITENPAADDAAYFAAAIESQSALQLTVQHATPLTLPKVLSEQPLNQYSAVVVADSGILSSADARRVAEYVQAGGAALVTLGPRAAKLAAEPITSIAIRKISDVEQRVAVVDDSHPILRDASNWRAVRFMKRIDVRANTANEDASVQSDRTLIALEDGSPLLIERTGFGERADVRADAAGRLLLLAAPLDRDWNDLAVHPLFVRFIADTARYLTGRDAAAMSHIVGAPIVTGLLPGATSVDAGGQIFDPAGRRVLGLDAADQAARLVPELLGFYEVRSNNQKRWLAVNSDPRESDLTPLSADNLTRWQALHYDAPQNAATPNAALRQNATRSIGFAILVLLAVLVLVESLLANYRLAIRRDGSVAPAAVGSATAGSA